MSRIRSLAAAVLGIAAFAPGPGRAQGTAAATAADPGKAPVVFTTAQDRQNMLDQLGVTKLRPGRDSNATAANPANYDQAKANPYPKLPDVLVTTGGKKVTTPDQWWNERRPEIVELLEREVYGRVPENVPKVRWEVRETREVVAGGKPAVQTHVIGVVDNSGCPEIAVNISMSLTRPKDADGPVPVLLSFGWTPFEPSPFGPPRGQAGGARPPSKEDTLVAAGWACATLNPATVQDDAGGWQPRRFGPGAGANADPDAKPTGAGLTRGIIGLTNHGQPRKPDQWGALRAWAWGASRGLDYLETVPEVDARRVGIAGVSRYGKAALVTLAFDRRFAAGLIASSGAGGTKLFRRDFGENLENLATTGGYHWMAGNYLKYSAEEPAAGRKTADDLPVDSHMTLALCAPRLTFISHGVPERGDAHWLDHQGSFMAAIAAQPVFRLLGARDLGRGDDYPTEKMPGVNVDVLDGALAWRQHDGGHTDGPNVEHFVRWASARWGDEKAPAGAATPDVRSLKEAAGDRFKIGVGVGQRVLEQPDAAALIRKHFRILTPENCMKPQSIHPAEDRWNFEAADRFAGFARDNRLEVVGHCLVWAKDDRTDKWMTEEDGKPVSRETLLRRIQTHVETVVGRYADVATMWDVVNEAVADSGDALLRDSVYSRTTGVDFLVTAFKAARAKDPDALLIYNDYNDNKPDKRKKVIELLSELKRKGAPVDAYGMQGHFELGEELIPPLHETFDAIRKLGLKVVVSELDIDAVTRGRWWADNGAHRDELSKFDPFKDGLPDEVARKQADQYAALFRLFDENRDVIARVSFWNLHDGESWLNDFPWKRVNHPLLFDRHLKPKPAFDAVYEALKAPRTAHAPVERRDPNSRLAHQQLVAKAKQGTIDVYFEGDSITRRWGATDYPRFLEHWRAQFHGWNAANFGWGGDTTHNILWRLRNGELDGVSPRVVVLQAGTNNLPGNGPAGDAAIVDVVGGIEAIVATFRQKAPGATVVLTALFPRPQNKALAPTILQINERLAKLADGKTVRFLNINDTLTDGDGNLRPGISGDGLHLEAKGYDAWAAALKPVLTELLGPPAPTDHAPPPTGDPSAAPRDDAPRGGRG